MKFLSRKNKDAGFTLVETLVAVAIFSVSIAAVISVTAKGITSTTNSKNRIVANYLAQEEIEYIRHLRNKYSEAPNVSYTWSDFITMVTPCDGVLCVTADLTEADPVQEVIPCTEQIKCEDRPVYVDSTGYYFQSNTGNSGQATPFRRYFTVTIDPSNLNEVKIVASVVWEERNNAPKNITLTETLTNWLPSTTP